MEIIMKHRLLVLAWCAVFGSNGFSTTFSGEWGYILNVSNEATITSYSGAGGAVTIPATLDGYPVKSFGGSMFMSVFGYNNNSVTSVIIPSSVTSIGNYAFGGGTSLTSVTIPEGVASIGMQAFQDCTSLTSMVIPNSVTIMGSSVFLGCINLKTLTIGTGLQLENGGLMNILGWGNVNLTHVIFADGTMRIADIGLGSITSLVSVTMPSSVTSIGSNAFGGCTGLTSAVIPDGVTSIGDSAFAICSSLPSVTIPNSVTSIGDYAFGGCTSMRNVDIPESVTSMGRDAFFGCTGLTSVTIPASVTSIGPSTFANCTSLVSVSIANGVTSIGDYAFDGCTSLTDGVVIPNNVTSIGHDAFSGCSNLVSIGLPQGVTNIGFWAFKDTALRSITIPESVVWLGSEAFFRAPITNVVIPPKFIAQYGTIGLSPDVSSALLFSALSNNFATSEAVTAAEARGVASVTNNPTNYSLYTASQYQANRITGVADGKAEVTSNPTAYSLFTESSIMDMNLGSLMLKKGTNNNALDLELTIETKDNLATNGWQVAERISRSVSMAGVQRQFLRVRADAPYVAPTVKVLAHPTLGNILTDAAGRVLYFLSFDAPGGNPMFSGASWPYVTAPTAPKADAGVTATLGSSSFGGGQWTLPHGQYETCLRLCGRRRCRAS
jgi:hypothetical protein